MKRIYAHPCAACEKYDFQFHEEYHSCTTFQWVCNACGIQMNITFTDGGSTAVQTPTGRRCDRTLALFKIRSAPHIMFIYRGGIWSGLTTSNNYENTCPTNLMSCEEIIESGELDPHGIFELVVEHCITGPTARDEISVLDELTELAVKYSVHLVPDVAA